MPGLRPRARRVARRRLQGVASLAFAALLAGVALAPARLGAAGVPVVAEGGMVVCGEPLAAAAGASVLEHGGNAVDAAVATAFVLAVTHPCAGNLGGGGFCTGVRASGESFVLDFRETAPGRAHRDMFLAPGPGARAGASLETHLAVGVPGTVAGLLGLLEREGTWPRNRVLGPAIALARDGFEVSWFLHRSFVERQDALAAWPASRAVFFSGDHPLPFGATLVQPDLAATLQRIADAGRDGFYSGPVAERLVEEMERGGGLVSREDLRGYAERWREPLEFEAAGWRLTACPPPSSGGVTLAQILGLLDLDAVRRARGGSAEYVRLLVEAERLAYADRNHWLGDPDFVDVPLAGLVGPAYLDARRRLLPESGAGASAGVSAGTPPGAPPAAAATGVPGRSGSETTHLSVADGRGAFVAMTLTLNDWFGTGAVVPGAGFLLNNEMDDFTTAPGRPNLYGLVQGEANAVAPGKRPLSSMTPLIARHPDGRVLALGSPGGSTIITTVLQVFLQVALFDRNVRDAVDAPRFHHQHLPDEVVVERDALSPDTRARLQEAGYPLVEREALGRAMAVLRRADGLTEGWADRRSGGAAVGARRGAPD